jgi:uncharacterized protein with ParB-like and HNH nuclease domain
MSKLNVDQKDIKSFFSDKKADFLIPDYQRPYAWELDKCQTLWDDIFEFAFPDNDQEKFNKDDEYFLGSIVTFKNERDKLEIIDGQQRLTTLMLLLRAFYEKFKQPKDGNSKRTKEMISQCIWKTNEFGEADLDTLKIKSEVATDNDKEEFLEILKTGEVKKENKSNYANNFRFFQARIEQFLSDFAPYFPYLPARILGNCILLPIEAESQDTALRIFSTLNDRGLPLSDADIFKAQFYKYYNDKGEKDSFIKKWKELESICEEIFHPTTGTPMDELFTRYMYYERARQGNKRSTTESLRKFYEKDRYRLLKKDETLNNLEILANFWQAVSKQDGDFFSDKILRKLFVLNYAPNGMWTYFVSVYFMKNKDAEQKLDDQKFGIFLTKITAFIWAYTISHPGVNALRTPVYAEMVNIVNGNPVNFTDDRFDSNSIKISFDNYAFTNGRPITKSMLAWWAFTDDEQPLLSLETTFEIEHIFPRNRQEKEEVLKNDKNLESLGNKALLEKRVNIRVTDYKFSDKAKYYQGLISSRGKQKEGTKILELVKLGKNNTDFTEKNIEDRKDKILNSFISFLNENNLIKTK